MNMKKLVVSALLGALLTLGGGCAANDTAPATSNPPGQPPPSPSTNTLAEIESTLGSIYEQANPSVVNIQVMLPPSLASPGGGALGSGFVWDNEGNIVTNNHVVDDANRITVTFYDGTTTEASLVGRDADSDLAVIKIDPEAMALKPVVMGDSTALKVGQLSVAIGNPFGLEGSMTVGFISSLGRLLPSNQNLMGPNYSIPDVIQTDAAVNPGNSGGILVDSAARVIGVTSSIATTSGTSAGVGFAIPSAIVQQVVPSLIETGSYEHPYLGVSIISLNPDLAEAMDLPRNQRGALVETVVPGGPADNAGVRPSDRPVDINGTLVPVGGDVIIAYNGQKVASSGDLITLLARCGCVGEIATLTVLRDGQEMDIEVTLGVRPTP